VTRPAEVTNRLDWADLVAAIEVTGEAIASLRRHVAAMAKRRQERNAGRDDRDAERKPEKEVDKQPERDIDEAELVEADRSVREDHESDVDLDGDTDPAPEVEQQ